jgi:putative nucleotidyltransferase with HDIG domain
MSEFDDLAKRVKELEAENLRLQAALRDLERSYDITLQTLGDALDIKQSQNEGHSRRVTAFALAIARAMGLPQEDVSTIARGAFLHDIGKMAIPDKILTKPGKLDFEEMAIMRQHCFKGYQILKNIPFLADAREIVYAHHERFDGSGYPRGLKGKEIPLGARIVAAANTMDSITSDLPYRAARSLAVARQEIQDWSGRQFDPEIVEVFQQMPDEIFESLRNTIRVQP